MNTEIALSLCNRAFVDLGEQTINDFPTDADPGSDPAVLASTRYESVVRNLLSAARWDFATIQQQLARLPAVPLFSWSYAYQMPIDPPYLRMVRLADSVTGLSAQTSVVWPGSRTRIRYAIRTITDPGPTDQRKLALFTDFNEAYVEYIGRTNEDLWPPLFQECVVVGLRKSFAMTLTDNVDLVSIAHEELYGRRGQIGLLGKAMFAQKLNAPTAGLREDAGFISGR